jgi:hypothetical protein
MHRFSLATCLSTVALCVLVSCGSSTADAPSTTAGATTLPVDEITATINGMPVSTRAPATLSYRQFATLSAVSKAGASLSYSSLAPACAINGTEITPLTGVGECAIAVTSAGNATASTITAILPVRLTLGTQSFGDFTMPKSIKAGSKIELPILSNFGEKISYKTAGSCSVALARATIKKGKCSITATASAKSNSYKALNKKYSITGK